MNTSPDPELVQLIAADLGVDASFIEKDWYAMRIIAALKTVNTSGMRLVFSGGTSLSKGFGLIQRFSEDLDFKVILPKLALTGMNAAAIAANSLMRFARAVPNGHLMMTTFRATTKGASSIVKLLISETSRQ